MNTRHIFFFLFLLSAISIKAQTFNTVSHTSGFQVISGNKVTVNSNPSAGASAFCGVSPYTFSAGTTWTFNFTQPVAMVRLFFAGMDAGQTISFSINGNPYSITAAQLSAYPGTCSSVPASISGGNLAGTGVSSGGQVDINAGTAIYTLDISHNATGGCVMGLAFAMNQVLIKQPFTSTMLCKGDTLTVPFTTDIKFFSGNIFTAELSDKTGDFTNAVNIGTKTADTSSSIKCTIPAITANGTGFRIRVRASNPQVNSVGNNGVDIKIGEHVPSLVLKSNAPLCEGKQLILSETHNGSLSYNYSWSGPNGLSSVMTPTVTFIADTFARGKYYLTMENDGCVTKDSINVQVLTLLPAPVINITVLPDTTVPYAAKATFKATVTGCSGAATYQWMVDGSIIPGVSGDTWVANGILKSTSVKCMVRCPDACVVPDTALSNTLNMHVTTGIGTIGNKQVTIQVYPNPNNGKFVVNSVQTLSEPLNIEVVNAIGQVVYSKNILLPNGKLNEEIDLGGVINGVYLLKAGGAYVRIVKNE